MKHLLCLLAICLYVSSTASAQVQTQEEELLLEPVDKETAPVLYFLALDKPRGEKRIRYYAGSEILFKMKGENFIRKASILEVKPNTFIVNGGEVSIGDVHSVTIHKKNGLFRQALIYLPAAGILYFLMDSLNPANTGREGFYPNQGTYIVSGGLVGAGLTLQFFKKRTYRIGERNMLKTLQVW